MSAAAPAAPAETAPSDWLGRAERALRAAIALPAPILVVAEVLILFVGIAARTFGRPIIWSDELAAILFLWLAMLGSVVAIQRGEHMRLTFLVGKLSPRGQAWCETLAVGAMFLFLFLMLHATYDYTEDQSFVETPALGWSGSVRALAMPVGFVAALLSCGLRLARFGVRDFLGVGLAFGVVAALLALAAPTLAGMGDWALAVFFVGLLGIGILSGVPIAFAFGLATAAYLLCVTSTPLTIVIGRMDEGMSSLILLAVPLFVLLGQLVDATGMARVMVAFLAALLGHVKAGMSYVLLGAMLLVSGISGSKTADMAAVAPVLFPEMRRRGMKEGELLSLLAASGAMSETIPPSIVLIAIASVTGVSIAALFTAGILPALVLALVLAVLARWRAGRDNAITVPRAPAAVVGRTLLVALPALLLPFLIRTAVVEGFATATEVSTIGIAYTVVLGLLVYRGNLTAGMILPMLARTASLSGAILFIVGAASAMSWALTQSGFSQDLAQAMAGVPGGRVGFLLVSVVAFIVFGSLLEGIPAIVLFGPLLFPIAHQFGIDEVHFSIVAVLAMGLGLFAPPFGLCYYAACIIGQVPPEAGMRRIWIYLGALFLGLLVITFVPWISIGFL
ncbi:TRAP transporter large permease subunit [Methylobacterium sp. NEAU 140]|uniref:TRAP transporter large permease n=1 Tax=Methylobacterium sp. NEAU 140 TaxID=3064945 RepID=UPI00273581D3|nr:TRAP transporter large permease subunit [Methylobacterium sp. NEAU 140]MDP4026298.1 TRAP transporter large permease subunit [Methylobacterium sp. NEAU 140]